MAPVLNKNVICNKIILNNCNTQIIAKLKIKIKSYQKILDLIQKLNTDQ